MGKYNFSDDIATKNYFSTINGIGLLSQEEEFNIAKRKSEGDGACKEKLIISNLRLVVKIAKNYLNLESSFIDLIQEGNIGLMKAAEKFDYRLGCRFSTYASYWIKHYITRFIAKKSRAIRVPIRKGDLFKKINKSREGLLNELGREPSSRDIALQLGVDEKVVSEILGFFQPTVSLEYHLNDADFSLLEVISDTKSHSPSDGIFRKDLAGELNCALDSLMDNERRILKLRFGFDDDRPITLKEVGGEFGVSAETVRQIETRAMKKIKRRFSHLQDYID